DELVDLADVRRGREVAAIGLVEALRLDAIALEPVRLRDVEQRGRIRTEPVRLLELDDRAVPLAQVVEPAPLAVRGIGRIGRLRMRGSRRERDRERDGRDLHYRSVHSVRTNP